MENKKFIVTIIILIIIIAGLGGFIAVDKLVLNKKDNPSRRYRSKSNLFWTH